MAELLRNFEGVIQPGSAEAELIAGLDPDRLPRHVAVIMDGNGRWAKQRGLPRVEGHRAGIESVKAVVEFSARLRIPALTLYAFSAENWKRPADEVNTLWSLLKRYLRSELNTLLTHRIRFTPIGRIYELPLGVRNELVRAQKRTADNQNMHLAIALNYSGRLELVDAFNKFIGENPGRPIAETDVDNCLYTAGLPELDLLVRTSGEMRLSNFLLWQVAYSEIFVSDVLWPDFRGIHLLKAITEYQRRERRFGGIHSADSAQKR